MPMRCRFRIADSTTTGNSPPRAVCGCANCSRGNTESTNPGCRFRAKARTGRRTRMKHPTAAPAIAGWRLSSPENKRLQSPAGAIDLARVHISFRVHGDDVGPVQQAGLAASARKPPQFLQILPIDDVDRVVGQVSDVHAALPGIGREIDQIGRAGGRLRRDVNLAHETALPGLALRIGAGLAYFGSLEDLDAVIAAIANIEL